MEYTSNQLFINDVLVGNLQNLQFDSDKHVYCTIKFDNGDCYNGFVQNNHLDGNGTMIYANGNTYIGDWKCGIRCGNGVMHKGGKPNGIIISYSDSYDGEWENDMPHGRGTKTYGKIGNKYYGGWKCGMRHGQGILTHVNGNKYVGYWENGKFYGSQPSGHKCIGRWRDAVSNGIGYVMCPDGNKYECELECSQYGTEMCVKKVVKHLGKID